MRHSFLFVLSAVLICSLISKAESKPHSTGDEKLALEALKASGAYSNLKKIPETEIQTSEQIVASRKDSPEIKKSILETFKRAFAKHDLLKICLNVVKTTEPSSLIFVKKFYKRAEIKKIVAEEAKATSPDLQKNLQAYAGEIQKNAPPPDRVGLIKKLDSATGASKNQISRSIRQIEAIAGEPMPPENKSAMSQNLENNLTFVFLYFYRNVSNVDLNAYISGLLDKNYIPYNRNLTSCIDQYYSAVYRDWAIELKAIRK